MSRAESQTEVIALDARANAIQLLTYVSSEAVARQGKVFTFHIRALRVS